MLKVNSMNIYGVSRIEDREVAHFNASLDSASGNFVVTKNVTDRARYLAHKSECDADFDAFEAHAVELSQNDGEE